MQIIFLVLVSILLVNCSGGKNKDNWEAPNIYYLRSEGNKNTVLTNQDALQLNDYIYFANAQLKTTNPEEMKNSDSSFTIKADVKCVSEGKSFVAINSYKKNNIQVKEILPIEATLYPQEFTSCKILVQLQNSAGSTKTYALPERNIDLNNFAADFSMNESVIFSNFNSAQILNLKGDEFVSLVCDTFTAQVKNPGLNSLSLGHFISKVNTTVQDIPLQKYKPNQFCRVAINTENKKTISNKFKIQFEKLAPQYSFDRSRTYEGRRLFAYQLSLVNPHSVPLSVALDKASLKNAPFVLTTHHGHDNDYDKSTIIHMDLSLSFSDETKVIDKGNVYVIHLAPGETVSASTFIDPEKCTSMRCVNKSIKHMPPSPMYHLEYNFRSVEEIMNAPIINLTERL